MQIDLCHDLRQCPPSGIEVRDELSSLTIHMKSAYFPGGGRESKTIRILAH